MFKLLDYSEWKEYDGFSEGSGRSEKVWLVSPSDINAEIGVFKFPKYDPTSKTSTYEHVSEHLASKLGELMNMPTARVEIGTYKGRVGSMSYLINKETEVLQEGLSFILRRHPNYDPVRMIDNDSGEHYALKHLLETSPSEKCVEFWIRMLIFDFLIGNSDRHQNNWAYIAPIEEQTEKTIVSRPCPLYDNGSSLCSFVREDQVITYLGNDTKRFNSLIDSKSKSMIRIDPNSTAHPTHTEVIRYLLQTHSQTELIAKEVLNLQWSLIDILIDDYPEDMVSKDRKRLLRAFLNGKRKLLESIMMERR